MLVAPIFFLSTFFTSAAFAQQGWVPEKSGTSNNLYAVSFPDTLTAYVVGAGGAILKSTDGGVTWTSQTSGTTQSLLGITFTNVDTGTVVGGGGTILHTTNGGVTWLKQTSGTGTNLRAVSFFHGNNGMAVGDGGTILYTSDGGTTWNRQNSGVTNKLTGVSSVNDSTWVAVGVGTPFGGSSGEAPVLRTTNAGSTWNQVTNIYRLQTRQLETLNAVSFRSNLGLAAGYSEGQTGLTGPIEFITSDGGASWNEKSEGASLHGCSYAEASAWYAVGYPGMIVRNGAVQTLGRANQYATLNAVAFANGAKGIVLAGNTILRTTDGGIAPPYAPALAVPANGTTNSPTNPSFKSTDSCWVTGSRIQISPDSSFLSVVYDTSHGPGAYGSVQVYQAQGLAQGTTYYWRVRTSNAYGNSPWSQVWHFTTQGNPDLAVYDSTLQSPWTDVSWGASVTYTDSNAISVNADAWGALSLLDGSWSTQDSVNPSIYTSFNFSFMGTQEFGVFLQTDSGQSLPCVDTTLTESGWVNVSIPVSQLDPNGTKFSRLTFQSDEASAYRFYVRDLRFVGLGQSSKAFRQLSPLAGVGTEVPKSFSLAQNYPNPFNPTTTIDYQIRKPSHVSLTVYDVLGRVVQTLVNTNQQAGSYSVSFNASGLASGVYLYRLIAGDHIFLKKMMLVK